MTKQTTNGARSLRAARGFTLIELIVALVIIGILTAIAIPNYTAYIQRSNRGEARVALLEASTWMQRWRTENGRYDRPPPTAPGTAPPLPFTQTPAPPAVAKYTIVVATPDAVSFTITATPTGVMAGDVCGNLIIDETGRRQWTGASGTMDVCWNR